MAMRGPHLRLLLPLVLLATCLALASGTPWARLQKKFRKHHVDFPQSSAEFPNNYCDDIMFKRGLDGTYVNTFIHAPLRSIRRVCSVGGTHISTGLRRSIFRFSFTTCRYNPQTNTYTEDNNFQHIVIACWNRFPVLYVE